MTDNSKNSGELKHIPMLCVLWGSSPCTLSCACASIDQENAPPSQCLAISEKTTIKIYEILGEKNWQKQKN